MRNRRFANADIALAEITFGTSRFVPKHQNTGGEWWFWKLEQPG